MMRSTITAFGCGLLFALGLGVAGMTNPYKVQAFLDMAGEWDPSLAFVMAGAIAAYRIMLAVLPGARMRSQQPPPQSRIDPRLVGGAALFGLGWGLVGLCPGPAIVGLATFRADIFLFVGCMLGAMAVFGRWQRRR